MPLSEYEQHVIDDLERSLLRDDPKLANAFRPAAANSYGRIIGVAIGIMLGISLLILGSVLQQSLLVAVGFGAIFCALAWAASSSRRPRIKEADELPIDYVNLHPKELATSNSNEANGKFMDRLEDRWNRRQSELG